MMKKTLFVTWKDCLHCRVFEMFKTYLNNVIGFKFLLFYCLVDQNYHIIRDWPERIASLRESNQLFAWTKAKMHSTDFKEFIAQNRWLGKFQWNNGFKTIGIKVPHAKNKWEERFVTWSSGWLIIFSTSRLCQPLFS